METTTELKLPENEELVSYLDEYVCFYQHIWRRVYEDFVSGVFTDEYEGDHYKYTKMIRSHYGILTRTANSIVRDVKGRLKALLALKKTQLAELKNKIAFLEEKIEKLDREVTILKKKAAENLLDEAQLRRLK